MALYKYASAVTQTDDAAFDKEWKPGETPDHAGIYRCKTCGDEIASNKGVKLPSQNHAQHNPSTGAIIWRLSVYAKQKK